MKRRTIQKRLGFVISENVRGVILSSRVLTGFLGWDIESLKREVGVETHRSQPRERVNEQG